MSHPVKTQQQVKQPELPTEELGTQTYTHTQKQGKPKWAKTFHPFASKARITRRGWGAWLSVQRHAQTFPPAFFSPAPCITSRNRNKMGATLETSRNENLPSHLKKKKFLLGFPFVALSLLSVLAFLNPLSSYLELIPDAANPSISCYPHWNFLFSYWLVK